MVMSQGTYTFLACFAGFWLIWAAVVMLCCFCSFLQRRLKRRQEERRQEERLRDQCLRSVEMEPLSCQPAGYPSVPAPPPPPPPPPPLPPPPAQLPRDPPQFGPPQTLSPPVPLQVPHLMPQANWVTMPDTDGFGRPPCYEEAVLMEDPPPPYSEVLADPRAGVYVKPAPIRAAAVPPPPRDHLDPAPVFTSEISKAPVFPERGYSSLIRLPSSQRWDSLGHLLSNMDLNHSSLSPPRSTQAAAAMATMPRREPRTHHQGGLGLRGGIQGLPGGLQGFQGSIQRIRGGIQGLQGGIQGLQGGIQGLQGGIQGLQGGIQGFSGGLQGVHGLRGLESSCGLPTAYPLLGRSTAV